MPPRRALCFASVFFFFLLIISGTGPIFIEFSGLVDVWEGLINRLFILLNSCVKRTEVQDTNLRAEFSQLLK